MLTQVTVKDYAVDYAEVGLEKSYRTRVK